MKTFDLDKFATERTVSFKGTEYKITGLTVEAEINGNITERITSDTATIKERYVALKEFIVNSSNIPSNIIDKMTSAQMFALFQIAQGNDPKTKDESDTKDEEAGNASKE